MNPEVPMALRLQGNLLLDLPPSLMRDCLLDIHMLIFLVSYRYGVSRVYSRQCVYTLTDVQAMLDRMKTALKVIHRRGLDPEAGKARYVTFAHIYAYIHAVTLVFADAGHKKP